jgi:hypothetical protein
MSGRSTAASLALWSFSVSFAGPSGAHGEEPTVEPVAWNTSYELAEGYFSSKDYRRALAEFSHLVELASTTEERSSVAFMVGRCQEMLGDAEKAVVLFDQVAHMDADRQVIDAAVRKIGELAPKLGAIEVECAYPDAVLELNGRAAEPGKCPAFWGSLNPGVRRVSLRGPLGRLAQVDVEVKAGQTVKAPFPQMGRLRIRVSPEDATVEVDDMPQANPSILALLPGSYRVAARGVGFQTSEARLAVESDDETLFIRNLLPAGKPSVVEGSPQGRGHGPWPWWVVGAGVAAAAAGAVMLHAAETSDVRKGDTELEDRVGLYRTLSTVGFVVGGAAVASGVTWLLWPTGPDDRSGRRASTDGRVSGGGSAVLRVSW